ncbi:MAG: serpin family protein [Candidatus Promineifilaceae bacterium]|nr:serpin family protein [Candidatus Promineifilaceae bacterium]
MRSRTLPRIVLITLLFLLTACRLVEPDLESSGTVEPQVNGDSAGEAGEVVATPWPIVASEVVREREPQVSEEALVALTEGNVAFSFDIFDELRHKEGNLFFSPYSISMALAMTYAGARGETARQMAETLHFALPEGELHPAINALDLSLAPAELEGEGEALRLEVANSLWAQEGFPVAHPFLDLLARQYGAGLRLVDYTSEAGRETAREAINNWVARQTEDKIKELIPERTLSGYTRLVLANAIYFLGKWVAPFQEVGEQPFTLLNGQQVEVPMMAREETTPYARGDGYEVVALNYRGGPARMLVLVPDSGEYKAFEAALQQERFDEIVGSLERSYVSLTMPSFEFESDFVLNEVLEEMGMADPFKPELADFSGMSAKNEPGLYISAVIHKAFVAVDEEGTEAAAATAVVMGTEEEPPEPDARVTVDRPFLFAIQDSDTGTLLFLGRVLDPRAD